MQPRKPVLASEFCLHCLLRFRVQQSTKQLHHSSCLNCSGAVQRCKVCCLVDAGQDWVQVCTVSHLAVQDLILGVHFCLQASKSIMQPSPGLDETSILYADTARQELVHSACLCSKSIGCSAWATVQAHSRHKFPAEKFWLLWSAVNHKLSCADRVL